MRKLSLLIIVFLSLLSFNLSAQTDQKILDEVIWIVGDEAILKSEVESQIIQAKYDGTKIEGNPYCVIPEQMAVQKLFLHQAALDSLTVNESSVTSEVEQRMNYFIANIGSKEKVEEYFRRPMSKLREEFRTMVRNNNLIQMMQQKLVETVQVTPSEVRRYFSNLPQDSVPTIPAQVELQVLSINPPIPQSEINRVKERLREFAERANAKPSDFSLLARLYSEDQGSAAQGGEIGFAGKGTLDPEFAAVAFNLQDPKKVSRIVQSEFGFHIIQLIEKRGDRVNCRHILLKPRATLDDKVKGLNQLDSVANLIRENKITFEQAVLRVSQDKNTAMNAGLMINPNNGTSKFEYQDLPSEIAKTAYDMNVGEVSKAFTMIDKTTGKEMLAIVKIKTKTPTHKANVLEDYQTLKNILEAKQKEKFLNEWIAKKQKETYISIDPAWRNCDFKYNGWIK